MPVTSCAASPRAEKRSETDSPCGGIVRVSTNIPPSLALRTVPSETRPELWISTWIEVRILPCCMGRISEGRRPARVMADHGRSSGSVGSTPSQQSAEKR